MRVGTLERKSKSLDTASYQRFYTNKGGIFDAMKMKMNFLMEKTFIIQHDGGKTHSMLNAEAILEAARSTNGWSFPMDRQPGQSPDLNILDLGFFIP
jgi:hypothetical protein